MYALHGALTRLLAAAIAVAAPVPAAPCPAIPPGSPPGQQGEVLRLEDAIRTALEHNHRLQESGAGVRVAEARADEARAARLPRVEIQESFQRTTSPVFVFGNLLSQEAFTEEVPALKWDGE